MKRIFASGLSTPTLLKTLLFLAVPIVLAMAAVPRSDAADYDNTKGDFILGFREAGSTTSIVVDLGPISNLTGSQTFSLGSLGSLLAATYGNDWATNPNVYFSLAATTRPEDGTTVVNYVTSPEFPADGTDVTIWRRLTQTNSSILKNKIINCGEDFNLFTVQSGTNAVLEPSTSPDAYQNFMPGGTTDAGHASQADIGWGFFNPTPEGSFESGAAGVILHLIQLVPGIGDGTDLGTFVLSANGNSLTFTPNSVPAITSARTATAGKGQAFTYQITATNSPTRYGVVGLPPGLKVNATTGVISGTPTKAGTFTLTLKAINSHGTGTATLTLTVQGPPVITSATTATATVGKTFTYQITATNNPTGFIIANNQPGLALNRSTGLLTGKPKGPAGTFTLTLKATNAGGTGTATLMLTIQAN